MSKAKKQVYFSSKQTTATGIAKPVNPVAPQKKEYNYIYDEVKCANGCGTLCDRNEYVHGYCSRACFMETYRMYYYDDF
jgi:hypothetical protein